jgi:hypothetical protein
MSKVSLKYTVTEQDWAQQMRTFALATQLRSAIGGGLIGFILIAAVLVGEFLGTVHVSLLAVPVFAALGALLVYMDRKIPRGSSKHRDGHDSQRPNLLLEVSDDGVVIQDQLVDTRFKWGYFDRVIVTEEFYFLIFAGSSSNRLFIPRRIFTSQGQETSLRSILEDRLPNIESKPVRVLQRRWNAFSWALLVAYALAFIVPLLLLALDIL